MGGILGGQTRTERERVLIALRGRPRFAVRLIEPAARRRRQRRPRGATWRRRVVRWRLGSTGHHCHPRQMAAAAVKHRRPIRRQSVPIRFNVPGRQRLLAGSKHRSVAAFRSSTTSTTSRHGARKQQHIHRRSRAANYLLEKPAQLRPAKLRHTITKLPCTLSKVTTSFAYLNYWRPTIASVIKRAIC